MKRFPETRPRWGDGVVALLVVALALGILLNQRLVGGAETAGLTAVIDVDGTQQRIDLSRLEGGETRTVTANGYTLRVELTPEGVQVAESDCPTQACVHTGVIRRAGRSIVCLPARVMILLEGTAEGSGLDAVLG